MAVDFSRKQAGFEDRHKKPRLQEFLFFTLSKFIEAFFRINT